MRYKVWKWIFVGMSPFILFMMVATLFYLPPFQKAVVTWTSKYISSTTGFPIHIGYMRLKFPCYLSAGDVQVLHHDSIDSRTLFSMRQLRLQVDVLPLFKKQLSVGEIIIADLELHTDTIIPGLSIDASVGRLELEGRSIYLDRHEALLQSFGVYDAEVSLEMSEVVSDTVQNESSVDWRILSDRFILSDVTFGLFHRSDSIRMNVESGKWNAGTIEIDLGKSLYALSELDVNDLKIGYKKEGYKRDRLDILDVTDLLLEHLNLKLTDAYYTPDSASVYVKQGAFDEQCGLKVNLLELSAEMKDEQLLIDKFQLETLSSTISLSALCPFDLMKESGKTRPLNCVLKGEINKSDLFRMPAISDFITEKLYPNSLLTFSADFSGSMEDCILKSVHVELPDCFSLYTSGKVKKMMDSLYRSVKLYSELKVDKLDFLSSLSMNSPVRIPFGTLLSGDVNVQGETFNTDLKLRQGEGLLNLQGSGTFALTSYKAKVNAIHFPLNAFIKQDSLQALSCSLEMQGHYTDFWNKQTNLVLNGSLSELQYGDMTISDVVLDGVFKDRQGTLTLNSLFPFIDFTLHGSVDMSRPKSLSSNVNLHVNRLDLSALTKSDSSLTTSFDLKLEGNTDLLQTHRLEVSMSNQKFYRLGRIDTMKTIKVGAVTDKEHTELTLSSGDLKMVAHSPWAIQPLSDQVSAFTKEMMRQIENRKLESEKMTSTLPDFNLSIIAGDNNLLANLLRMYNLSFNSLNTSVKSSRSTGLSGEGFVRSFQVDTVLIDTIAYKLSQDSLLRFSLRSNKMYGDPMLLFSTFFDVSVRDSMADMHIRYLNGYKEVGLDMGVSAVIKDSVCQFQLYPDNPIIAFTSYRKKEDLLMQYNLNSGLFRSNLVLIGENGSQFELQSLEDSLSGNHLRFNVRQIPLAPVSALFPYYPSFDGFLQVNAIYKTIDSTYSLQSDIAIDSFVYDRHPIGDWRLSLSYMPGDSAVHAMNAWLMHDRKKVIEAFVNYYDGVVDSVSGNVAISSLPLWLSNLFISDELCKVKGGLSGDINIQGSLSSPIADGQLRFDTTELNVIPADAHFSLDTLPLLIKNNRLVFNRYPIYAAGKSPFLIDGTVRLDNMEFDLDLMADNYPLINAKKKSRSLVYGKAFVALQTSIKGPINALRMRGDLHLLGNTDLTYILKESPLSVQDRLSGIVNFVSYSDTIDLKDEKKQMNMTGIDITMMVHIDPMVRLKVDLSESDDNNIVLEGGGDLSFQLTSMGEMFLSGRYTLTGGNLKYSLPVIPLKTFKIKPDSYVEWTGNLYDPYLSLTAVEHVKTSVIPEGESARSVDFEVSVSLYNRLEDMKLSFDLNAPEETFIQNELAAMTAEERMRKAINLMLTNTYQTASTASGGKNLSGNGWAQLLQSEINNIAGNALKDTEFSVNVEEHDIGSNEGDRTDYSFHFAKRFYNNRIRVVIGGKISTGDAAETNNVQSFIDNISIEYRLDASGTRFVHLYYDKDRQSLLEGEVTETGAGIVLRRKVKRLRELFLFKKRVNRYEKLQIDK